MNSYTIHCPLGPLQLTEDEHGLCSAALLSQNPSQHDVAPSPLLSQAVKELTEYFAGNRQEFTIPLSLQGTPFQRLVWETLRQIPYGETRSYAQIAQAVGSPHAARAVGMACHRNPILLFVPCHRVVAAHGALGGFACGLKTKQFLLDLEQRR